jgi:hypothetical protein
VEFRKELSRLKYIGHGLHFKLEQPTLPRPPKAEKEENPSEALGFQQTAKQDLPLQKRKHTQTQTFQRANSEVRLFTLKLNNCLTLQRNEFSVSCEQLVNMKTERPLTRHPDKYQV